MVPSRLPDSRVQAGPDGEAGDDEIRSVLRFGRRSRVFGCLDATAVCGGVRHAGTVVIEPSLLVHVRRREVARRLHTLAVRLGATDRVRIVVGAGAPRLVNGASPDLIVLDGDADAADQVIMVRRLREVAPSITIIVCRQRGRPAGAHPAIVANGNVMVTGSVVAVVAGMLAWRSVQANTGLPGLPEHGTESPGVGPAQDGRAPQLTRREMEVLRHLAEGESNRRIGEELFISEQTVKTHVRRILRKVGADHRTNAVAEGFRRGLLS
jgi:two-component system, NarL family, nitrate/nitrite response regulator NarL